MNNAISPNPSVPAENAFCQQAPNRWTQAAWALGRRLTRGPLRTRNGRSGDRLASDLIRLGMVEHRGAGWLRITDAGLAAFPGNRCARWRRAFDLFWIDLDAQQARACTTQVGWDDSHYTIGSACDVRPDSWRRSPHFNPCN